MKRSQKKFGRKVAPKVRMRSSLKKARIKRWSMGIFKLAFLGFVLIGLFYGKSQIQERVSMPQFFMVKSVRIHSEVPEMDQRISAKLQHLKGKKIWDISPKQTQNELLKEFSVLKSVRIFRGVTGTVFVRCELRTPLARTYWTDETKLQNPRQCALQDPKTFATFLGFIDEEGVLFPKENFITQDPQVSIVTSDRSQLGKTAKFLSQWNKAQKEIPFTKQRPWRIVLDPWQEILIVLKANQETDQNLVLYWGHTTEDGFLEKWKRLSQVWMDLENKNIAVESIDARYVNQLQKLTLQNRQILGRIIVTPTPADSNIAIQKI